MEHQKNLFVSPILHIGPNLVSKHVSVKEVIITPQLVKCSKVAQSALQPVLAVYGAMMSANGCLVIENTPPTKGIAQPDLIMASVRVIPKKMIKTSRDTIENKKSQFKQAQPHLDSQASPNLPHAPGTKFLGQLPKNGARGFIRV